MRDIKFRAWGPNSKYMWPWGELGWQMTLGSLFSDKHGEKIVMQFTGLHDKNGKEIYEGDVLRCIGENYIGTVSFKSGCFVTDCEGWGEVCMSGSNLEDIEVIGNIHENPELLEELV